MRSTIILVDVDRSMSGAMSVRCVSCLIHNVVDWLFFFLFPLFSAQYEGGRIKLYINHFKQSSYSLISNGTTTWIDESGDYDNVSTWQRQCRIDDVRVPTCLGLSFPFLFFAAWCLWKRKENHLDVAWRRITILTLILFAFLMFLACEFWWQGCHNYAKAATRTDGTAQLGDVRFTGSHKRHAHTHTHT